MPDYELHHYGVVGMKWGVHRGKITQAYSKAGDKLDNIDRKFDKRLEAFHKLAQKAETSKGRKHDRYARKANEAGVRAAKTAVKGKKWIKAMRKNFKGTSVSLSENQIKRGKKYTDYLTSRYNSKY